MTAWRVCVSTSTCPLWLWCGGVTCDFVCACQGPSRRWRNPCTRRDARQVARRIARNGFDNGDVIYWLVASSCCLVIGCVMTRIGWRRWLLGDAGCLVTLVAWGRWLLGDADGLVTLMALWHWLHGNATCGRVWRIFPMVDICTCQDGMVVVCAFPALNHAPRCACVDDYVGSRWCFNGWSQC